MPTETVRLTQLSHGAGCACKLPAGSLHEVLATLPRMDAAELIVGHEGLDDAAVWRVTDELAVVQTIDFFTPLVDDPYQFGRIAATNAFSDIYAMGARPAFALNVVAFPKTLPMELLGEILHGGADVAAAAGAVVAGGHSIDDPEPKYGMAVTGFARLDEVWTNAGGRAGDVLVLSKPIGTGIVTTALKRGDPDPAAVEAAVASMTTLNAEAARLVRAARPHAVTDVTGFGLVGHARELAAGAGLRAEIDLSAVRLLPGVRELLGEGHVPGGTRTNLELAAAYAEFDSGMAEADRLLACDAQTSGGLFVALPADRAAALPWPVIGRLVEGPAGTVTVR
jgi:selenide, water dikinase